MHTYCENLGFVLELDKLALLFAVLSWYDLLEYTQMEMNNLSDLKMVFGLTFCELEYTRSN